MSTEEIYWHGRKVTIHTNGITKKPFYEVSLIDGWHRFAKIEEAEAAALASGLSMFPTIFRVVDTNEDGSIRFYTDQAKRQEVMTTDSCIYCAIKKDEASRQ